MLQTRVLGRKNRKGAGTVLKRLRVVNENDVVYMGNSKFLHGGRR